MSLGDLEVFSLADRPDLAAAFWSVEGDWPTFMLMDPVAHRRYEAAAELYPDLHLCGVLDGQVVARLHSVPIDPAAIVDLPERGWDWALETGVDQPRDDRAAISLIEARISPAHRGRGLSSRLLAAALKHFRRMGASDVVGPVRPTSKPGPHITVADWAAQTRDDGLPSDAWLRVHVRLGGRIVKIAPLSMTIPGTLRDWRAWTGEDFTTDGLVEVPGALAPVLVDTRSGHAVYVEANVWTHHTLT